MIISKIHVHYYSFPLIQTKGGTAQLLYKHRHVTQIFSFSLPSIQNTDLRLTPVYIIYNSRIPKVRAPLIS